MLVLSQTHNIWQTPEKSSTGGIQIKLQNDEKTPKKVFRSFEKSLDSRLYHLQNKVPGRQDIP